jgi:hypothetical protein
MIILWENHRLRNIVDVYPCVDTAEVYFLRYKWNSIAGEILQRIGCEIDECKGRNGRTWGYRVYLNWPISREQIVQFERVREYYQGIIARIDPAFELQPNPPSLITKEQISRRLKQTTLLKYRRKGPMLDYESGGVAWVDYRGRRKPRRNIGLYVDKPNRVTGELNCVHFEPKLYRADTIRRQGIHRLTDLFELDLYELVIDIVKWSNLGDMHVNQTVRKAVKRRSTRQVRPTKRRYHRNIEGQVRAELERTGMDRAQMVKDRYPRKVGKELSPPFDIPNRFIWSDDKLCDWMLPTLKRQKK